MRNEGRLRVGRQAARLKNCTRNADGRCLLEVSQSGGSWNSKRGEMGRMVRSIWDEPPPSGGVLAQHQATTQPSNRRCRQASSVAWYETVLVPVTSVS